MVKAAVARAIGIVLVGLLMSCAAETPPVADQAESIRSGVPEELAGWQGAGDWEAYDRETIFGYIDGHAEVYLAYGMKRCLSRRYAGPEGEPDIVVDLFELASSADAFGAFTHDRDGEVAAVGQAALFRSGWLSFWQGPWFGSVYAEGETEASRAAVMAIGTAAATAIGVEGELPQLLAALPAEGLEPRSERFLRSQEILNTVHYLGFDNPFGLGSEVEAVVGRYRVAEGAAWLLVVRYPDEAAATLAEARAAGTADALRREGAVLAAVLGAEPPEIAAELIARSLGGAP